MSTPASSRRADSVSPLRRASQYALIVGIVLAIASLFGSVWIVRVGVLAAAVGGVLALGFAWRELREERTAHARDLNRAAHAHGVTLGAERRRNAEVVEALGAHNERADSEIRELEGRVAELRGDIGQLQDEVASLGGANAVLRADLAERDHRLGVLGDQLRAREAELAALRDTADDAEVLPMPKYAAPAHWDALPTAEELFGEGDHPTVVDLQKLVFPAADAPERRQA